MSSDRKLGAEDILAHMGVPGEDGLYVIGCFERRVTLYSQQVRALNLIWALAKKEKLSNGTRVLVIGAGVAGLTAAAGAAKLGATVTVLEKTADILPFGRDSEKRWLHPRIYDWPLEGSENPHAGLPVLDWTAGSAKDVVVQIEDGFKKDGARCKVHPQAARIYVPLQGHGPYRVTWEKNGTKKGDFEVVIVAVGFGLERERKGVPSASYWVDDSLQAPVTGKPVEHVLISGTGDGGLIDLLRALLKGFHHEKTLQNLIRRADLNEVKKELKRIEEEAHNGPKKSDHWISEEYEKLSVPDSFDQALELRADRTAILHGKSDWPLDLGSSILNRFLVSRLLWSKGVPYRGGELTVKGAPGEHDVKFENYSGNSEKFHRIVVRYGAESALKLDFKAIDAKCGTEMRSRNALDQTRFPLWPADFFGPPPSAAPSTPAVPNPLMYGLGATSLGAGFIGRDQALIDLHTKLQGTHDVALTSVAAHGGGGYGKTRLATEYAYRYVREYPGGVFYAEALQRPPVSILAEMGRRLLSIAPIIEDLPAAEQFVKWLGAPGRGAALLVFDDVQGKPDDVASRYDHPVDAHGSRIWPLSRELPVKVLFTTRLATLHFATPFRVNTLDDAAAFDLLVARSRTPQGADEEKAAKTLASRTLAGHPLGLRLAGSYIGRTGISFRTYADLMAQRGVTATLEDAATVAPGITDHDKSIRKTFDLSLEDLDAANPADARAQKILLIAATLAPGVALDRRLIRQVLEKWEGAPVREDEVGSAIARLVDDLALLEGQDESLDVIIHPLVADFARDGANAEVWETALQAALQAVRGLFPYDYTHYWQILRPSPGSKWEWLSPDREGHAQSLFDASRHVGNDLWLSLAIALGDLHDVRGERAPALLAYMEARTAAQSLLQESPDDQELMWRMGMTLQRMGDVYLADGKSLEARVVNEESLTLYEDVARRASDNDDIQRELAVSYDKLGDIFRQEGEIQQALETYEKSLAIRQHLVDNAPQNRHRSRDLSISLENVAKVRQRRDDHAAAVEFYQQALTIARRLADEDPTDENAKRDVSALGTNLALALHDLGKLDEAVTTVREGIAIQKSLAEQDPQQIEPWRHVGLARSRYNLAVTLLRMPPDPARAIEARTLLLSARDMLLPFAATDRLSHNDKNLLALVEKHLALLPAPPSSD